MSNRIVFKIIVPNEMVTAKNMVSWLENLLLFQPDTMVSGDLFGRKELNFDKALLLNRMNKKSLNRMSISLNSNKEDFVVRKGRYQAMISGRLKIEDDQEIKIISNRIEEIFLSYEGIVAFIADASDSFWQNNTDIKQYELIGKSQEHIVIISDPIIKSNKIVDIEQLPGHSHFTKDLWFGSCWRMWFGEGYYPYIPKKILSNINSCFENIEVENNSMRITLYPSIWEYNDPRNRNLQWLFRIQAGMDVVSDWLRAREDETKDNSNASIEIFDEQHCVNGGIKLIKYYYDEDKQCVSKKIAKVCLSMEIDNSGNVVWEELLLV
ncbi:hypothetical protein I6N90_24545 [Paenibacillus sp. GSMTC-2017]|uniref:hypothetical protein n=1 Tax=Paenibacillus sp. GSMTC-2017 TaxID=2794350 RepID=UPI0018D7263E|nr:hypothetical protein [Paenibacillus sp. GSMTC-2017]MBH5320959.1 hypothetical protein [Paenibacillus sp. GSMTC-2017]